MDTKHLPTEPGVYLMKDAGGTILYIGKAKNLRARVKQYFVPGRDGRAMVPYLTSKVKNVETLVTFSEKEALLLENNLIKKHQPQYNVLLKDDKTFISIKINHKHKWPMIRIVRTKGKPKDDGLYYGPYTSALSARDTLELLSVLFPLRQCSDRELASRTRPCLLYGIKRCIAPCVNKCTKQEYDEIVKQAIDVLSGKNKNILKKLELEREKASDAMEFERAGDLHKAIEKLEYIGKNREAIAQSRVKDCDVFALHREGDYLTIVKLIFREGRIIGSNTFPMQDVVGTNAEVWETFLLQHYTSDATLPKTVLVPEKLPTLAEILTTKIIKPERGSKKKLLDLAKKNAKVLFAQESMDQKRRDAILLQLEEILHLTKCPLKIECFDTSNISGSDQVASMVTYTDGIYNKKGRRTYKIKESAGDDYAAMREVQTRRYTKGKEKNDLPDLIIVDGGKGQLNILTSV
ncbi:MAG: excinuclease ABC subunit UvrC, partial [Simkaniaceae bacterium]|nr:excinuclease ABC subunit UvrC [Simkaniaceae bacterium]